MDQMNVVRSLSFIRFLECAVSAGADYIITGNARHFPDRFESIRMVTPKEFLALIAPEFTKAR